MMLLIHFESTESILQSELEKHNTQVEALLVSAIPSLISKVPGLFLNLLLVSSGVQPKSESSLAVCYLSCAQENQWEEAAHRILALVFGFKIKTSTCRTGTLL